MNHDCWKLIEYGLSVPGKHMLLHGPPGTGKTYQATDVASDVQIVNLTCTEDTPAAELRGHFILKGGTEGSVWMDGPAVAAWESSQRDDLAEVRLVINEIDALSGDGLVFLYGILDDPAMKHTTLTLPTGRVVRPTAKFRVVATMNGSPDDLPEALRDRFKGVVHVDKVHPNALAALPEWMRGPAQDTTLAEQSRRISVRSWLAFAEYLDAGVPQDAAIQLTFGEHADGVLDAVRIARVKRRKIVRGGPVTNPGLDEDFTAWDDVIKSDNFFCGWHGKVHDHATYTGEQFQGACQVLAFEDAEEWADFCHKRGADPTWATMPRLLELSLITRCRQQTRDTNAWRAVFPYDVWAAAEAAGAGVSA